MKNENYNFNNYPIKIAIGDLRHKTAGKHSFFMPVGIGYIASYTLAQMDPKDVEIRLYDDPDIILKDINNWLPQVVALSNYSWNSELSRIVFRHAKKMNPQTICIAGGPDFPTNQVECKKYLSERPEIDFYVYFEGEVSFARLIKKIQKGTKIPHLKSEPQDGVMSIHSQNGNLIFGPPPPRIMNMDEIPSPYLQGLMDQWFNGSYAPSIETARGCPFTCGYCFVGSQPYYHQIATFSVERIKKELTYIAQRINKYPDILLSICDSDFGMYERDEQIAVHIRSLQDEFGWPDVFSLTTGKRNYDRILRVAALLKDRTRISCSVQSLNPKTLEVIKRKNPSMDEYQKINIEIKKRGMNSTTEVITPLPEETKKSFFKGLKSVINIIGVDQIVIYTTIFLNGTYLASEECRKKYQMQTKFRILPKQFGEYLGKKCFEIEEVCVATNKMSFNDYLEIRGFSLVSTLFSSKQFDVIDKHLQELEITKYDYIYYLWELIKSGKTALSEIYNRYIEETKEELWDSRDEIYNYFTKQTNYDKLVSGKLGDNVIRKYKTEILLEGCIPSIELAYSSIENIAHNIITEEIRESLIAAKRWAIALRDVSAVFKSEPHINNDEILNLPYDVNSWYLQGAGSKPLITYNKPSRYQTSYNVDNLKMTFVEAKKLFGGDLHFQISKLLINRDIRDFWRQCKSLKQ